MRKLIGLANQPCLSKNIDLAQDDTLDEGWREAVPKACLSGGRRSSGFRRPSLAKLNTIFMNVSQSSRFIGNPSSFTSPRIPNEAAASVGPALPVQRKFVKSASFSPKRNNPTTSAAKAEKFTNPNLVPNNRAPVNQVVKSAPAASSLSVQGSGKLFSYKEVALAPPGTIVKAVAERLPNGNPQIEHNPQVSKEMPAPHAFPIVGDVNDMEEKRSVQEKPISVSEEDMSRPAGQERERKMEDSAVTETPEELERLAAEDPGEEAGILEVGKSEIVDSADADVGNVVATTSVS